MSPDPSSAADSSELPPPASNARGVWWPEYRALLRTALAIAAFVVWMAFAKTDKASAVLTFVASIAWPLSIVLIVWWFRDQIKILLTRVIKVSAMGAEFSPGAEAQQYIHDSTEVSYLNNDLNSTYRLPDIELLKKCMKIWKETRRTLRTIYG